MQAATIKTKSVYEKPLSSDGQRILVMRFWPEGISASVQHIQIWHRDASPSPELLRRFDTHVIDWQGFTEAYIAEMAAQHSCWLQFFESLSPVTLEGSGRSPLTHLEEWGKAAENRGQVITLLCDEPAPAMGEQFVKCHRRILRYLLLGEQTQEWAAS